jgi:DNA-binding XRE family transcriptional regulator
MANPPHEPTDAQIATVRAMSAYGIPQDDIAKVIGIDPKTLRKHYSEQLEKGSIEATAKVAEFLFRQATTNNVAAAMFWMKCRAGWSEKTRVEVSQRHEDLDLTKLSSDDLAQMEALHAKASIPSSNPSGD